MRPFLSMLILGLLAGSSHGQLLSRWFGSPKYSSNCPGGVCPTSTAAPRSIIQAAQPGHWSYPGSIDSHLEGTHGVSTAGMSRQQKLDLHDSLHEGTARSAQYAAVQSAPRPYVQNTPQLAASGGSSGNLAVGMIYRGEIVASIGSPIVESMQSDSNLMAGPIRERIGSNRQFRKVLLEAASKAVSDGTLSEARYNALRLQSLSPRKLEEIKSQVGSFAAEEGVLSSAVGIDWSKIDWEKLMTFIVKWLPVIINLFGNSDQVGMMAPSQMPLVQTREFYTGLIAI